MRWEKHEATSEHWRPHVSANVTRAAILRKRTALSALIAIIVAASASTAMLNLFVDVQGKLRKEFRGSWRKHYR